MPISPLTAKTIRMPSSTAAVTSARNAVFTRSKTASNEARAERADGMGRMWNQMHGVTTRAHELVRAGGQAGDFHQLDYQLRWNPSAAQARSRINMNNLMHEACIRWSDHPEQPDVLRVLASHAVDVNAVNHFGRSPLENAAGNLNAGSGHGQQAAAVTTLLQWQADPTPAVFRRAEVLARQGDPWLANALANPPMPIRL